jgi:hypothetical protein
MHLASEVSLSLFSFFSALVHMYRVQLSLWMLPPSSLFFSSSSRLISLLMAPSMEIKQWAKLQINCF